MMKRAVIFFLALIFLNNPLFASYENALSLFKEGKFQDSLTMIADELKIEEDMVKDSPNYKLRFLAAHNHWKMKNYKNALSHLERCTDIKPDSIDPIIDRCLILLEMKRLGSVAPLAYKALKIKKDNAQAYFILGEVKLRWKNYWGAKELLEKALSIDAELYNGWNSLGLVFMNLGKLSKANTAFSTADAIYPDNPVILNNLAICHSKLKEYKKALTVIEKAAKLDGENPEILKNLTEIKKLADESNE